MPVRRVLLGVVLLVPTAASADVFQWVGGPSGDFSKPSNWTNTTGVDPAPPDTGDDANFLDPGPTMVDLSGDAEVNLFFNTGFTTIDGSSAATTPTLTVTENTDSLVTQGGRLELMNLDIVATDSLAAFGSGGRLSFTGDTTAISSGLEAIADAAVLLQGDDVVVDASGLAGTSTTRVGSTNATGELQVSDGATLTSGQVSIGVGTNASGDATATGTNTSWVHRNLNLNSGELTVSGGAVFSSTSGVTSTVGGLVSSRVEVRDAGSRWDTSGSVNFGSINNVVGELLVWNGGVANLGSFATTGASGASGVVVIDGAGSQVNVTNNAWIGPQTLNNSGTGRVEVRTGAQLAVSGALNVQPDSRLLLQGGTVQAAEIVLDDAEVTGHGSIDASLTVTSASTVTATGGPLTFSGASLAGPLAPGLMLRADASGTLELDAPGVVQTAAEIVIDGGGLDAPNGLALLPGGSLSGYGIVVGQVSGLDSLTGSPSGTVDFRGRIDVGSSIARIYTQGRPTVNGEVSFAGGQINTQADDTIVLGTSGVYRGFGNLGAEKLIALPGSRIVAEGGTLTVGSTSGVDGFSSGGELEVDAGATLVLRDANQATLDSSASVELGDGAGGDGTLTAANGLIIDFGANVTGHGLIDTPDNVATPMLNNGAIAGESLTDPITLSGYVKGVGTCDNCVFTGTDAPGFSPAAVTRGSARYEGRLEIEVGGTAPGSEHDQVNHLLGAGVADLGGELAVELIDGFTPASGDAFELLTATGGVSGEFDTETLPALGGGLSLDVQYGANSVWAAVVGIEGDYNLDGKVDAADYTVWRDTEGMSGPGLAADGDLSGAVDAADYAIWAGNYGLVAALAVAVPEPSSAMMLLIAVVACRRRG